MASTCSNDGKRLLTTAVAVLAKTYVSAARTGFLDHRDLLAAITRED